MRDRKGRELQGKRDVANYRYEDEDEAQGLERSHEEEMIYSFAHLIAMPGHQKLDACCICSGRMGRNSAVEGLACVRQCRKVRV